MATVVTRRVAPSGGDFTTLSAAVAAAPTNFVAADEQWIIEVEAFPGGLLDRTVVGSRTADATRYLTIRAAAGHEYDPLTDIGAKLRAKQNFAGALDVTNCPYIRVQNLCIVNTGSTATEAQSDAIRGPGTDNMQLAGLVCRPGKGGQALKIDNAENTIVRDSLLVGGVDGVYPWNFASVTLINVTVAGATGVGFRSGTTNADNVAINCLAIDCGTGFSGNWITSGHNAATDATAPGTNSLQNRTSADVVDAAGGDYRTASASPLATAGDGVNADYIGWAVEATGQAPEEFTVAATANFAATATLASPSAINVAAPLSLGVVPTLSTPTAITLSAPLVASIAATLEAPAAINVSAPLVSAVQALLAAPDAIQVQATSTATALAEFGQDGAFSVVANWQPAVAVALAEPASLALSAPIAVQVVGQLAAPQPIIITAPYIPAVQLTLVADNELSVQALLNAHATVQLQVPDTLAITATYSPVVAAQLSPADNLALMATCTATAWAVLTSDPLPPVMVIDLVGRLNTISLEGRWRD